MLLSEFNLANPLYALARVWVYEVDTSDWTITTTLAPVYQGPLGAGRWGNPMTLDSDGKWWRPAFVDRPVILRITNAQVPSHDTGITGLQSTFMGDWAAGETYLPGQIVRDGAAGSDTGNLYACQENHTAAAWVADLTAERWVLYLEAGAGTGGSEGSGSREYTLPEDFGAIGDGVSRTPRTYLGITTGDALRAYNDGVWSFATDDDVDSQIDYLAVQAQWFAGGMARGTPKAEYKIDHNLIFPNGCLHADFRPSRLTAYDFVEDAPGVDLLTNPSFDSGQTGWTQGTLGPRTDIVFSGGKASFTDPPISANASYGDFGQQVTMGVGKWTVSLLVKMSDGASQGFFGPPYMNMGFRSDGVGLGGFDYPHPLSFGSAQLRTNPFEDWITFDVEVLEPVTAWLDIQGGNCNWEVQEAHIRSYGLNYFIWCTGDDLGLTRLYDASTFHGGEILGPVEGNFEGGMTGPEVGAFLHKNFRGEGARCNQAEMLLSGWDVGITLSSQAFLNHFSGVNIVSSRTCVKFLANSTNAGENLRFDRCVFANSLLGLHAEGGGEWSFWGCSIDFCQLMVKLERQARVSWLGHHFEFNGAETRLAVTSPTGSFDEGETLTGGTSGATARLIFDRSADYGHLVIEVLTGTFVDGEDIDGAAGSAVADGAVEFGGYLFDIQGGSTFNFSGEFLQSGGSHRGALHMFNLETNLDVVSCSDWWAYGLKTASDTLCTGAGRFMSRNFQGPGNAQLPAMIMRNMPENIFGGNGRIYGPGSMHDMGYLQFALPSDDIGLIFGAYSLEASGSAAGRGLVPWEQNVAADATVYTDVGYGSIKMEYNPAYSSYTRFCIFVPVQPGDVILWEYMISKPDAKPYVTHGPFTYAPEPDEIFVNTTAGSSIVTIQDNQASGLADYGPAANWTVTLTDVAGDPGGIPNAVWNATHTIIERLESSDVLYTVDLGAGNEATATVSDAGGTATETTYEQTSILIFDANFWVTIQGFDAVGRPIVSQTWFQGEDNFRLSHDAVGWTLRQSNTYYSTPVVPSGTVTEDRYANGRAPKGATHCMKIISWDGIRFQDPAAPPPIYLTDFFGNKL